MHFNKKLKPFFELLSDDPKLIKKHKDIRYVVLTGGRGSGKSYALSSWVNAASYKSGWGILFTRYTMTSARTSVIPEFKGMCEALGNDAAFNFRETDVVNLATNVQIDYKGLKPQSKTANSALKSVAGKNVFIVEEAEELAEQALFDKVDLSIRTKEHKNIVVLVLNPCHINHFIYKEFIAEPRPDTLVIHTTYLDNYSNLDQTFINKANRVKERDLKKYRHLFLGEWQKDTEGALFYEQDISQHRVTQSDFNKIDMAQVVVAYDPAVTDTEKPVKERTNFTGNDPDCDGIIVAAKGRDGRYYIMKEATRRGKRSEIAHLLVQLYHQYDACALVIESNNGKDFIPTLIKTIDKYVRCVCVTATRGKAMRAQPIQALYENGEVSHVGYFNDLEFEMTSWVPDTGMPSPNSLDAMVWGLTYLSKRNIQAARALVF
jgi:phage terminase large subunit-like protein